MANKRKSSARHSSARLAALPNRSEEGTSLDVEVLRQIIELLEASDVTRLSWRKGKERLLIYRGSGGNIPSGSLGLPLVSVLPGSVESAAEKPKAPASADISQKQTPQASAKSAQVVTSPFVGTFYRTPAPDQRPFVEVGSTVKKGQVLCIIEAMKLMNEIESEIAGTVSEILAENGQPVEFGQPLFRLDPA
jgi:acetyl-CoA carboxylase biotin carboxyl carrier protein